MLFVIIGLSLFMIMFELLTIIELDSTLDSMSKVIDVYSSSLIHERNSNNYLHKHISNLHDELGNIVSENMELYNKFMFMYNVNSEDVDIIHEEEEDTDMVFRAKIHFYTPSKDECGSNPEINAAGVRPKPGISAAVSRDLKDKCYGKFIFIENVGVRFVDDLMATGHENSIDLCVNNKKFAFNSGIMKLTRIKVLNQTIDSM